MPEQDENSKINELKYEGLTSLIITGQENAKERHEDLKEFVDYRFNEIDSHNKKQNGSIEDAMKDIGKLKDESNERKLTCMSAVEILQKRTKYTNVFAWIDKHQKRAAILGFGLIVGAQVIILQAVNNGWLRQIWELIKTIKG